MGAVKNTYLDLSVRRAAGTLSSAENTLIENAAMDALATWGRACLLCGRDALSMVRVNKQIFASAGLLETLSDFAGTPPAAGLSRSEDYTADQIFSSWNGRLSAAMGSRINAYMRMSEGDMANLCRSPLLPRLLGERAHCANGALVGADTAAQLDIILNDGFTSCDNSVDTIACEKQSQLIEFNVRDYTFGLMSGNKTTIGSGRRFAALDLVFVHEIGHWLGLAHLNRADSIMSETLEQARCITNSDIELLLTKNMSNQPVHHSPSTFKYR